MMWLYLAIGCILAVVLILFVVVGLEIKEYKKNRV
jgi:hypothetical protein